MKFQIHAKNIKVSEKSKRFIEDKISSISRQLQDEDVTVQVKISQKRNFYTIEVTIPIQGDLVIKAEATAPTFQEAVPLVVDKIRGQMRTVKTRMKKSRTKGNIPSDFVMQAQIDDYDYDDFEDDELLDNDLPQIVRVKRFAIKPMSPEEAVMQMELIGHDFFVFLDAETDDVSVVYKRKDGQYGLIEPQFN